MSNSKKLTDEKLVKLICNQDQEIYREVVERYQNKLLRYAGYLMGDYQEAADVVQVGFEFVVSRQRDGQDGLALLRRTDAPAAQQDRGGQHRQQDLLHGTISS